VRRRLVAISNNEVNLSLSRAVAARSFSPDILVKAVARAQDCTLSFTGSGMYLLIAKAFGLGD